MPGPYPIEAVILAFILAIVALMVVAVAAGGMRGLVYLATRLTEYMVPGSGVILWADFKDLAKGKHDLLQVGWAIAFILRIPCRWADIRRAQSRAGTCTRGSMAQPRLGLVSALVSALVPALARGETTTTVLLAWFAELAIQHFRPGGVTVPPRMQGLVGIAGWVITFAMLAEILRYYRKVRAIGRESDRRSLHSDVRRQLFPSLDAAQRENDKILKRRVLTGKRLVAQIASDEAIISTHPEDSRTALRLLKRRERCDALCTEVREVQIRSRSTASTVDGIISEIDADLAFYDSMPTQLLAVHRRAENMVVPPLHGILRRRPQR